MNYKEARRAAIIKAMVTGEITAITQHRDAPEGEYVIASFEDYAVNIALNLANGKDVIGLAAGINPEKVKQIALKLFEQEVEGHEL